MSSEQSLIVTLKREEGYRFQANFGDPAMAPLWIDEAPPLGQASGPNPARLLTVAVVDCLSASLLFCLGKGGVEPEQMECQGRATLTRNSAGRIRIGRIQADLHLSGADLSATRSRRCLELFEEYCVVSASVRKGVPLEVRVWLDGELCHESCDPELESPG